MTGRPRSPSRAVGLDALLLLAVLAALVGAACGGAGAGGGGAAGGAELAPPATPAPAGSTGSPATPDAPSATAAAAADSSASSAPSASSSAAAIAPPAPTEMKPPSASTAGAELTALGLDPANLPPIGKLEPRALRGVMKVMARSLGIKCADCHVPGDFGAPTRRKKIAARMWDEFAAKLTAADGAPLFCDSCHQGRVKLLDRSDKKALGRWMQASFVDGVRRKDGQPERCESCHVGWDMTFLSTWGR